jgi:hypothetical protein
MLVNITENIEITKEQFLDNMRKADYARVNYNGGEREIFGKIRMDFGVNSYDYPDGQPAFVDVSHYKYGFNICLGEYLDDEDMQYFYSVEDGKPLFTIDSGNPSVKPIEIMFLKSMELN